MWLLAERMRLKAILLIALSCQGNAQAADTLTVLVRQDAGFAARAGEVTSRPVEVRVTSADGRPAGAATVTFSLPREGPGGRFSSGLTSESVMTDSQGRASVSGIAWNDHEGEALIQIKASLKGEAGAAVYVVSVRQSSGEIRTIRSRSGSMKWIAIAAAAGGALAGLAVAGGKGGTAAAAPVSSRPALAAPTVGAPLITIGKP
ncbi:MAG: hypothetical protein C0504_01410 [Candidatus Solibacter sp.]|nr:hypothetical protein [Candidatus Solibacter sp.]